MTYLTQSELMHVLQKGKMKQQSSHLSNEEKETIAKYIAQSEIVNSVSGSDNNCPSTLEKKIWNKVQVGRAGATIISIPEIRPFPLLILRT